MDPRQEGTTKSRPRWAKAFLDSLAITGNVSQSAKAARIERGRVYDLRREDESFAKDWDGALDESVDLLEKEARRRAMRAVNGSDTLLIFLLKGARPERYRDNYRGTVTVEGGSAPLTVAISGLSLVPPAMRAEEAGS